MARGMGNKKWADPELVQEGVQAGAQELAAVADELQQGVDEPPVARVLRLQDSGHGSMPHADAILSTIA